MKICRGCGIEKPELEFYPSRSGKDHLRAQCKLCTKEANNHYRKINVEKIRKINRIYRDENKEQLRAKSRKNYQHYKETIPEKLREWGRNGAHRYRKKNPDKAREATIKWVKENPGKAKESRKRTREKGAKRYHEQMKRYREQNRDIILERDRLRRQTNPEKYRQRAKRYIEKNREKILLRKRTYQAKNRDRLSAEHNQYCKKRRNEDPLFKLISNIRTTINRAITRDSKGGKSKDLLGCSIEYLKKHIESQFLPGMSWDNWTQDGWHIDHRFPIASFNLLETEQQKRCFHYTNLQPLWAKDNLKKRWDQSGLTVEQIKERVAI